jgi:hypothetical protein
VKYLFVVLIPIVLLLGCEENSPTMPQPSEGYIWNRLASFPTSYYASVTKISGLSYDDFWICGYYQADTNLSDGDKIYYVAHYFNNVWWYYFLNNTECYINDLKVQPETNDVWITIWSLNSLYSGIYKYDPNYHNFAIKYKNTPTDSLPFDGFPFYKYAYIQYPFNMAFIDDNAGVMIPDGESYIYIFDGVNWMAHPTDFSYADQISIINDPDLIVYCTQYSDEIIRWSNGITTIYPINHLAKDVYMFDDNNGFLITDDGVYRKINGGAWSKDITYPDVTPMEVDGINGDVWIRDDSPNIWHWHNGEYTPEEVRSVEEAKGLTMLKNNQHQEQGLFFNEYSVFKRDYY